MRPPLASNSNQNIKEYSKATTPISKELPQVVIVSNGRAAYTEQQDKMTKSVDMFNGKSLTIDSSLGVAPSCGRFNSVDSPLTLGTFLGRPKEKTRSEYIAGGNRDVTGKVYKQADKLIFVKPQLPKTGWILHGQIG
ncbi:cdc42 GTPase-activating protein [Culex quinquefasciatus]|uniref:Cdc42 GTPase-activating protein n=1 Tax=Culex quinquefasciatus TaxID=7176 RepID=B0W0X0_CULQU|nr:cdc42 GTPase-activating protein [Culex quinquefasciatus]|eukprot:XP_001842354.1 cdc42 GTPase-activating protein [Culex quinquefasciatus]